MTHSRAAISALVLTRNEEEMLPGCLASIDWADEVLVVDSFSTDRTAAIAEAAANVRFLPHEFENFSAQYNWGIAQASHPWILIVDADEVVDETLRDAVLEILSQEKPEFDVYQVLRDAFFLGKRMKSSVWSNEPLPRFFRKGSLTYSGRVHSHIDFGGVPVGRLKGRLLHYSYRSMAQYFDKMRLYSDLWAEDAYAKGKRVGLARVFAETLWRFFHNYFIRLECIDGSYGLLTASLYSVYTYMKYMKLMGLGVGESRRDK